MAPGKPKGTGSKSSSSRPLSSQKSKISKSKAAPPKQQKSKRPEKSNTPSRGTRKKKKTYTAEELGLPQLNGIVPVGVTKPKGKKKGKVFVDDQERMMTILAMVNAEAEGKVESKIMKQRQLEEIREARRIEAEKRDSEKKGVLVSLHLPWMLLYAYTNYLTSSCRKTQRPRSDRRESGKERIQSTALERNL